MRILFADDDRELCRAARTLLEHEGYAVETVYNGSDALEMAETGSFDGIILDWMMPEMSGISVLSELRAPVYGVVAFAGDEPMTYEDTAVLKLIREEM